ncbi:MAG: hypothetical protein WD317_05390 [Balneolaceae bacterium]
MHKFILGLAGFCLTIALFMIFTGHIEQAGQLFILFFVALGIGFRGYSLLKGFAYTV